MGNTRVMVLWKDISENDLRGIITEYPIVLSWSCFVDIEKYYCGCTKKWEYTHVPYVQWKNLDEMEQKRYKFCPHCRDGMRIGPFLYEANNCDEHLMKRKNMQIGL